MIRNVDEYRKQEAARQRQVAENMKARPVEGDDTREDEIVDSAASDAPAEEE